MQNGSVQFDARLSISRRIRGCSRFSSQRRWSTLAKTSRPNAPRSRLPSAFRIPSPKRDTIVARALVPGRVTLRATTSASTTRTPRSANSFATVDLPLPMPPVSPTLAAIGSASVRGFLWPTVLRMGLPASGTSSAGVKSPGRKGWETSELEYGERTRIRVRRWLDRRPVLAAWNTEAPHYLSGRDIAKMKNLVKYLVFILEPLLLLIKAGPARSFVQNVT